MGGKGGREGGGAYFKGGVLAGTLRYYHSIYIYIYIAGEVLEKGFTFGTKLINPKTVLLINSKMLTPINKLQEPIQITEK